jgi:hypothetical protein
MKMFSRIPLCLGFAVVSHAALAQTKLPVSQALDFWISNTEKEVVLAAHAIPEEKYCCAPTAGEFAGARIFAPQVKHLAANNYRMSAYMLTQTPTPDQESESGPDGVRSKPQIMDYVKDHSQRSIEPSLQPMRATW